MPQKYLTIGDVATLVHHRGPTTLPGSPPDRARGATIVCVHDAGGNGNTFAELMDHLADGDSPLSFDLPGHGRSAGLDSLGSIAAMAAHLLALADAWAIDHPVLVGEGMGAAVAIEAASSRPGWAAGVVAVGDVGVEAGLDDEIGRLEAITSGKARREFDGTGYAPDTDRAIYQRAFGDWVMTDPRATLGDRRAQAEWSCPTSLATPLLVVVGEHADHDEGAGAGALADRLGGRVEILPGAGRHGVIEQPAALAALIAAFSTAGIVS
ncbi:MAG: alpha/beta fold hydrolase [Acidimicrobiales bacterium]